MGYHRRKMAPQPLPDVPAVANCPPRVLKPVELRSDPDKLEKIVKSAEHVRGVAEAAISKRK